MISKRIILSYEYCNPLYRIMQRCEMHKMIILKVIINYRIDIRDSIPQMDEKCPSSRIACG